jgi:glutamine amidotransferase
MCELFAMSSRIPATVTFSLETFARHGGLEGPHKDGWGIAHYVDGDVRLIKEAEPAADSACVRFVQDHPFASSMVVSHIRKATLGGTTLRNCQPFTRELGGRMHVFAHNGHLDENALHACLPLGQFRPVGDTDSEYAFCALLERLREDWLRSATPTLERRRALVSAFAQEARVLGPCNFLYCDGDALFIHGHRRTHGDAIRPPGLHVLTRRCLEGEATLSTAGLALGQTGEQHVVIAASVPLTDERGWRALEEGELVVARGGALIA